MPELPEVETVRRTLEVLVVGKTIKEVAVSWPKMIKEPSETAQFTDSLKGQEILGMGRRGKFLIFYLNDVSLVSHLRMEGKYALHQKEEPVEKHTHVVFTFTDGTELRYRDVRKFGTMHLFKKGEELLHLPLLQLGPEPFEEAFTPDYLHGKFEGTSRIVKAVLLDQTVMVGLGNIYVDEALFRSGIHPDRKASSLTVDEVADLHHSIIATLREAVDMGGSTIRSYVNSQGQMGMFQQNLYVYSRNGEACRTCGTPIEKKVSAGRGTHYCPHCQRP
ncbi:DNA-formamidopyrimidine glycosylase [Rossellomorea marisflavi]|uniref:DNA-formamidopyrimidine glycosylase n=1 Tax=Rossellomorea marisflavi TaxID=189381 RepID=UPI00207A518C|nr:DNA-formamidopyrimidine glycosylase [Rossellomorea marisflavi]USK91042.1 DNA-formamidopyrimidine glycosylase [Rossellomorea marisflavi]